MGSDNHNSDNQNDGNTALPAEGALQENLVEYTGTAAETREKAGMPQMDHTTFPSQLFWLTVTFVALYVVLARFIMPRIHDVLETRQDRIGHDLDRAARLQQEAEAAKSAYQKALDEARKEAQDLMAETLQSIKDTATEKHAELDVVLKSKLEESVRDITVATDEAQSRLAPVSVDLTAMIVEKLTGKRPSEQEVEMVLGELSKNRRAA